jgi:hypothetical protein
MATKRIVRRLVVWIVTNVLNETGSVTLPGEGTKHFVATTLGTVTGNLRGAVGVYFFSITGQGTAKVVAEVHHHWVTEAGDNIFLQDATATGFRAGNLTGIYAVGNDSYTVKIIGGTGRFAGAMGQISSSGVFDTKTSRWFFGIRGKSVSHNRNTEEAWQTPGSKRLTS